jgi:signal transduction histidine kinase
MIGLESAILEAMDVGLHVYHLEELDRPESLRIVYSNPAATRMTQDFVTEVVGKYLLDAFPGLVGLGLVERYAALVRSGGTLRIEQIVGPPDDPSHYALFAFPLPDHHLGVIFENITGRVRAEADLRRSDAVQRALVHALPDRLFRITADGGVSDARGSDVPPFLSALLAPHARHPPAPGEVRVMELADDGQELEIRMVRGPDDGVVAFARDISERKRAERRKDEFISIVGHELRTPLTSIHGALGLIEAGVLGEAPGPMVQLVSVARSNTDRLVRLINDMLDLDKMEAGSSDLDLVPLDANELADVAIDGMHATVQLAGVRIRRVSEGPAWVLGDRDRLLQVLTNLLSNAVRFSPPQAAVTVTVSRGAPGRVRFTVSDEGPGLPPDSVEHLFRRFAQVGDPRRRGSGLGLAICKAIVEQHGGEIGLGEGRGGVFQFEIREARSIPSSDLLSDLRAAYRASLPEQVESLIRLLFQGGTDALQAAHRLHGTAGTYGVAGVSAVSASLEAALLAGPLTPAQREQLAAELRAAVARG